MVNQESRSNDYSVIPFFLSHGLLIFKNDYTLCQQVCCRGQSLPVFTADMNQHVVSEATQPGTSVYTLLASSQKTPEDVRFFIRGTETFTVDELSGQVTLNEPLDREVSI